MKTSLAINQQVPEFVRTEYPVFVEFLKAYYKWYEDEFIPGNIEELLDIDYTIDEYVKYFRNQLDIHGITIGLDDREYLKRIKEIYHTKGSFQGIEFLLRLTQNQSSNIITPWDYVFKPSDGKWHQDISIIVNVTSGNIDNIIDNQITFTDINGKTYKTFVINVNKLENNKAEIFVSRFQLDSILSKFTSTIGTSTVSGTCVQTTSKVKINSSGSGFRIGQVFTINSTGGSGTLVKIKRVNEQGSVQAIEIIKFGTGYTQDFSFTITPPESAYYITQSNATLEFTLGSICVYPGYYSSNDNIIGDTVFIQDSKYYQVFSYVTSLESNINQYADLLRKTAHPSGSRHFANYQLNRSFQIIPQIDPTLNVIAKGDALRDFTNILEDIRFALSVIFNTQFTSITDSLDRYVEYIRSYSDEVLATETLSNIFNKYDITDEATITDIIGLVPGISITDAVTISDAITSFGYDRNLSDTVEIGFADPSGLYKEPYYAEPLSTMPYWNPGYTEDEREFTN